MKVKLQAKGAKVFFLLGPRESGCVGRFSRTHCTLSFAVPCLDIHIFASTVFSGLLSLEVSVGQAGLQPCHIAIRNPDVTKMPALHYPKGNSLLF